MTAGKFQALRDEYPNVFVTSDAEQGLEAALRHQDVGLKWVWAEERWTPHGTVDAEALSWLPIAG